MPFRLFPIGAPEPLVIEAELRDREPGTTTFRFSHAGAVWTGAVEAGEAEGVVWLEGHPAPFYSARVGWELHVWVGGEVYRFSLVADGGGPPQPAAREVLPPDGEIRAPMPGQVLRVNVAVGQTVEAATPLLVLESMKMELTVTAPVAGQVVLIHAAVGQMVDLGAPLVRLEGEVR